MPGARQPPGPPPEAAGVAVTAWRDLVDAVGTAGERVAALASHAPEVDMAEGLRYVLDLLSDQLDRAALRDSGHPVVLPAVTPARKLLFDNPDTDYDTALIDGRRAYRIRGERGTSTYLAVCTYAGDMTKGEATRTVNLSDADMRFDADGTFAVTLSATEQPGNWIRLDPDAHAVIVRQYYLDRATETPARFRIEALDDIGPDPALDAERFARLAHRTASFVRGATALAIDRTERVRAHPNRFASVEGHGVYGTPDAGYVACWYELGPGEALVVDVTPPPCRYWGVHLSNRWGQSLDHRTRPVALNARSATAGPDGSVRIVVAERHPGPGVTNWLDTAGHPHGWVLFRWLLADGVAMPEARVTNLGC